MGMQRLPLFWARATDQIRPFYWLLFLCHECLPVLLHLGYKWRAVFRSYDTVRIQNKSTLINSDVFNGINPSLFLRHYLRPPSPTKKFRGSYPTKTKD